MNIKKEKKKKKEITHIYVSLYAYINNYIYIS